MKKNLLRVATFAALIVTAIACSEKDNQPDKCAQAQQATAAAANSVRAAIEPAIYTPRDISDLFLTWTHLVSDMNTFADTIVGLKFFIECMYESYGNPIPENRNRETVEILKSNIAAYEVALVAQATACGE